MFLNPAPDHIRPTGNKSNIFFANHIFGFMALYLQNKLTNKKFHVMRVVKISVILLFMVSLSVPCRSQNPYVPTKPGTKMEYVIEDPDGKIIGRREIVVESAERVPEGTLVKTHTFVYDGKGKLDVNSSLNYSILVTENEVAYLKEGMVPPMELPDDMEIELEGDDVKYPVHIKPGETLPQAEMTVYMIRKKDKKDKTNKVMTINSGDRIAGERETITVPAGTYECITVTEEIRFRATMGIINDNQKSKKWYAPGVGQIQSVQYDKKGRIENISKLTSITQTHVSNK